MAPSHGEGVRERATPQGSKGPGATRPPEPTALHGFLADRENLETS
jgi:hypothetical protein